MEEKWYIHKDEENGNYFWSKQEGFTGYTKVKECKTKKEALRELKKLKK